MQQKMTERGLSQMKKFVSAALAVVLMSTPVLAAQVEVNGNIIDAEAVIVDNRTLVPVRGVFEELGYEVTYDNVTKTANLTRGSSVVTMTAGNTFFTADGNEITPEVPQQIIDGRFMLPLRAVGEAIGAEVSWDAATKTAIVNFNTGLQIVPIQVFGDDTPVTDIVID